MQEDADRHSADLLPRHAELLRASAISPPVASARGYRSATRKAELRRLGFSDAQARTPALLVPVWNVMGEIQLYQIRPDMPRIVNGKALKYETPKGARMILDAPPGARKQLRNPTVPLFLTEGIRKADAAVSLGLCCLALLGVWNFRGTNEVGGKVALADWESVALNGRKVYIVFDSDVMEKAPVQAALARLTALLESRGADVWLVYLPHGPGGTKQGLDDFLAAGHSVDELLALATDELRKPKPVAAGEPDPGATQCENLVALAQEAELFHTPAGALYATYPASGHRETCLIRGKNTTTTGFRRWLYRRYYEQYNKTPSAQAVEDALRQLEARAAFDGPMHVVHTRIAAQDGTIYIDLGNVDWEVVEVSNTDWRVTADPPVKFRRPGNMGHLPHPVRGGSLSELRPFVNVATDADWCLLVAWLVAALRVALTYAALILLGEQGTAKSTAAKVLRRLIDPTIDAPSRGLPREERDLAIAAHNSHMLVFSNISRLGDWLSDALCRVATGEGFATRELYTDDGEAVFGGSRPICMNGIEDFVERGDLIGRSIILHLQNIGDDTRRDEVTFWTEFEAARPRIFGALLDAVSVGLRRLPDVKPTRLPRMADFAKWVIACEPALPWRAGVFMGVYSMNQRAAVAIGLDASPIASVVQDWAATHAKGGGWTGTATDLLKELTAAIEDVKRQERSWPKKPHVLSNRLRRDAPALRSVGTDIQFGRGTDRGGKRLITVKLLESADASESVSDAPLTLPIYGAPDERPTVAQELALFRGSSDAADAPSPSASTSALEGGSQKEKARNRCPGAPVDRIAELASEASAASETPAMRTTPCRMCGGCKWVTPRLGGVPVCAVCHPLPDGTRDANADVDEGWV